MYIHEIDDETRKRAAERLSAMRVYNLSHRGVAGNIVGALGEVVLERWLERQDIAFEWLADTHYDYRIAGETVEVKTKDRTVRPLPRYEASVPDYNVEHQRPDWYAFLSLQRQRGTGGLSAYRWAYLVGISRAVDYHAAATRWDTDEIDPDNGTQFWTACWNVRHSRLGSADEARTAWKEAV